MRAALRLWRSLYGGNPLHLLAMIGCFALVGYAVSFVYEGPTAVALLLWFGGAVLGHDLVLYPLYALADQPLTLSRRARRTVLPDRPPRVPAINHIRVPVLAPPSWGSSTSRRSPRAARTRSASPRVSGRSASPRTGC